jgi:hypothetical protein
VLIVTACHLWNQSPDVLRITVDWLPEDGINRCWNVMEQKLVCDLVYMVVVHKSWLIQVMLENMMHGTYDMKIDAWKVTAAGNGEEEKTLTS